MRLSDLERELAAAGFRFCRQRGGHLTYKDAAGRALVIKQHVGRRWGSEYCRGELVAIRRSLARLLSAQDTTQEQTVEVR